jgi:hypothetical protein
MRENIVKITSDLTGTKHEGADVPTVKITVNGKSGTLDVTGPESEALAAFIAADTDETRTAARDTLRALFAAPAPAPAAPPKPARKSGSKSGSKGASPENTAIREWAASPDGRAALGIAPDAELSSRGRLPREWADAYSAAHAANPAA